MGERLFGLTRTQLERFVRMLDRDELSPREDLLNQHYPQTDRIEHCAGVVNSPGITARSGAVPGTGTVTVKKFYTGTAANHAETRTINVFNLGAAITTDSYVVCHRHPETGGASTMGPWVVDVPQGGSNSGTPPTAPGQTPCYAVRNNGNQSGPSGATATVTLDTQIHRYPDDATNFTLTASEVFVVERKVVLIAWNVTVYAISNNILGMVWLEDDEVLIKGTEDPYSLGPGQYKRMSGTITHVMSAANKDIRIRIQESGGATSADIAGDAIGGFTRLDISVLRDP